nr:transposase [Wolbachia endosymbiont of Glossina morsitans morsitans]
MENFSDNNENGSPIFQGKIREQDFSAEQKLNELKAAMVIERTFAWINRNRRLSKEYDLLTTSTESFIYLAMSKVMLSREYA